MIEAGATLKAVELKRINPQANIAVPEIKTAGAAGVDLQANIRAAVVVEPGKRCQVPTGVAIHMNDKTLAALLLPRSSLGAQGIISHLGLIDSDYQGELSAILWNISESPYIIKPLDRIVQLLFVSVRAPLFQVVDEFTHVTARGTGGFGSTGRK